ncbi:MAG: peptidylprolyl isomerase [Rhodospirillales bacterium CG15_BIG_FIL_POST_REV_8_21_14_020_66_15]|nr:MAG: peptidylprolyl isomerase [Rhodospirillales bacterium CG15_BIG_FIL_POST_REV_8_21_14_020_66_15]
MPRLLSLFAAVLLVLGVGTMNDAEAMDLENTLYMDTSHGRVVIQMRPDLAPKHVARIKELTRQGFYDGLTFHRVIGGFMAQGGDPNGTGTGGSGQNLPAEFSSEPFKRGTVGMARSMNPNSADSQFFICYARTSHLDGQYTVWGQVVEGMKYVGMLERGEPPANPDKIVKMQVAADAEKGK